MATLDRDLLRKLAEWITDGLPVTSLCLDVDGRRYPRRADYLVRLEDLLRGARAAANAYGREQRIGVCRDLKRIEDFVRDEFDRRGVRGLAVLSCHGAGLWEEITLPRPVRDRVVVAARPYLLPLEDQVETYESFCTAIVNREKARLLVARMGEIEEVTEILDEVPGWHDQGGRAQARHQRHIKDHAQRHFKHVAEALMSLRKRRRYDHLILAGPDEAVAELERELHDYVRRTIRARASLAMTASTAEVLERSLAAEENLERVREREAVSRLVSEVEGRTGRAVAGLGPTLEALEAGRVEGLVVLAELDASGLRCSGCGHLAAEGRECPLCGGEYVPAPDIVEEAVESALRQRCRVETVGDAPELSAVGGIGAILRF